MPFLYDWDFIFLFSFKFWARHRWKVILWFDWIQIAHFMNVSFISGYCQTDAGRVGFFATPPPSLTFVSMETGRQLTSHNLWTEELWLLWFRSADSALVSVHLSAGVVPFPDQPQFDCCCTVTQPTLQRAAQASSTLPLEGALQSKLHREKWFWFYWEYKMFYQNPFTGFSVFFIDINWETCVHVCVCLVYKRLKSASTQKHVLVIVSSWIFELHCVQCLTLQGSVLSLNLSLHTYVWAGFMTSQLIWKCEVETWSLLKSL